MFKDAASPHGFQPVTCFTLRDAETCIAKGCEVAAIICSEQVLDGSYRDLLVLLARTGKAVPVFLILNNCTPERRAEAQALGAAACHSRPATPAEVNVLVSTIASRLQAGTM